MRILITSDIFPPDVGGPATYVPRIAAELTRRGHDVTVVTYSQATTHPEDVRFPFPVVRIALATPQWLRIFRTISSISRYGQGAVVIYANGLATETVMANAWLHKPIVAKVVGDLAWERSRDKGWLQDDISSFQSRRYSSRVEMMRRRRDWTFQRMHHTIVPSGYLRDMLVQCWGLQRDRVSVIYNAFDPATVTTTRQSLPLTTQKRLITVCRLTSWKGVDGLIALLPSLPDVGLVIVGDGPMRSQLERQARELGVLERVHFAGNVPREQVAGYLKACDLFVLNSTYEGLPHVILEAMDAGLPVIAADAGGTRELVVDGVSGLLVPPRDAQALRQGVARLLADPDEMRRLVAGERRVLSKFSARIMADQTESVLLAAAEGSR